MEGYVLIGIGDSIRLIPAKKESLVMNPRRGNGLAVALECCNPGDVTHVFLFLDISLVVWKGTLSQLDGLLGGVWTVKKKLLSRIG